MSLYLVTGDSHLGKAAHLYPERLAEQEAVWADTLRTAREQAVAAVIHCGDLFDSRRPGPDVMLAAEQPLVEHHAARGCPVHAIPGNHDVPTSDGPCGLDVLAAACLIELDRSPCVETVGRARVGFLPWTPVSRLELAIEQKTGARPARDETHAAASEFLVEVARDLHDQGAELLVGHWSVSGSQLPSGLPVDQLHEAVIPASELEQLGFAYVALGHIHRPGHFGDGTCFYVGSPMPLDHGEARVEHGCWIVDMHNRETEFVPLDSTRFVTLPVGDLDLVDVDGAVVRVKGTVAAGSVVDHQQVRRSLLAAGAKRVDLAITVERAARPDREPVLDTDRGPGELLAAWLDQEDVEDSDRLVELAGTYLAGDRTAVA